MAPHPHHRNHHLQAHSSAPCYNSSCSSCSCYYTTCCAQPHHPPPQPPPPPPIDQLLQALSSHIYQPAPPPLHFSTHEPQSHHRKQHVFRQLDPPSQPHHSSSISSLLHRIEALESSLHQFSPSLHNPSHSLSLRDVAARTIQTHFRAFLVRRSKTLRQLKDLSFIKSTFNSLKSSFSSQTHINFDSLSLKAMDLLLNLDCIQGSDPMIRDGKISISRDLVRFLELIDTAAVRRNGLSLKSIKSSRYGQLVNKSRIISSKCRNIGKGDQKETIENLRRRVEKIHGGLCKVYENDDEGDLELEGFHHGSDHDDNENPRIIFDVESTKNKNETQPRVKKNVSFAEHRNVYKVYGNTPEKRPGSNGNGNSFDGSDSSEDILCNEAEEFRRFPIEGEDDEERQIEDGASPQISDGERNIGSDLSSEGIYEIRGQGQKEGFVFSAPLPVKMEPIAELMKKRKGVRIVT